PEERARATALWKALKAVRNAFKGGEVQPAPLEDLARQALLADGLRVDYAEVRDPVALQRPEKVDAASRLFLAAFAGKTRLIDNGAIGAAAAGGLTPTPRRFCEQGWAPSTPRSAPPTAAPAPRSRSGARAGSGSRSACAKGRQARTIAKTARSARRSARWTGRGGPADEGEDRADHRGDVGDRPRHRPRAGADGREGRRGRTRSGEARRDQR